MGYTIETPNPFDSALHFCYMFCTNVAGDVDSSSANYRARFFAAKSFERKDDQDYSCNQHVRGILRKPLASGMFYLSPTALQNFDR
jgi:hypothetical protein